MKPRLHSHLRLLLFLGLLLALSACADMTRPTPTGPELEEVQLAAVRRHPYQTWSSERVSRVFLRLLPCLPQIHGHTYPFLGFSWWVTATGKVAVDHVWRPSPARDAGLQPGDLIVAVNNWPLPTWVEAWDQYIRAGQELLQDFNLVGLRGSRSKYRSNSSQRMIVDYVLPGELLAAFLLDFKHIAMETRPRYLTGPVELLVQRDEAKFTLTLYPQHLPAQYGILINTQDRKINAYAAPGRIILTQRLVNFCLNDDELALVIGHELAHQAQGHLVRNAGHRQLALLAGEVLTAFTTLSLGQLLNWKHFMVAPDVRMVSRDAVVSVFSRNDEREADTYAQWYDCQAGYSLDKGLMVLERIAAVDAKDPFATTYFLDSHPAPLERLARLKTTARYFKAGRAAEVFLQSPELDRKPPP
jgi:Zn-dependent protease with chaperone function